MNSAVLQSARGPFLVLPPACVFLAWAQAVQIGADIQYGMLALALLGALLAHVSVNALNEYEDFKSGLDLTTNRTPFSGGSGALPSQPAAAPAVLALGVSTLLATILIGLYIVWEMGWEILPIGLAGTVIILTYTRQINRNPWACLIAPGMGFGFLMVAGSYFTMTGSFTPSVWLAAAVPFFLVNNLLLLNQYPDIDADKTVGRHHFPIAFGTQGSSWVYASFALAAGLCVVAGVLIGWFPVLSLIALLPLALGVSLLPKLLKLGKALGTQPQIMGLNVLVTLATPVLLGLGLIFG